MDFWTLVGLLLLVWLIFGRSPRNERVSSPKRYPYVPQYGSDYQDEQVHTGGGIDEEVDPAYDYLKDYDWDDVRNITQFHSKGQLADGRQTGTLGAITYLLDDSGKPSGPGYHDIEIRDGQYFGSTGAMTYLIDKNGWPQSSGYHTIEREPGGYVAETGDSEYHLDLSGKRI